MTLIFLIRIDLAKASVALRGFLTLDPAALASFCKYPEVNRKWPKKKVNGKIPHSVVSGFFLPGYFLP